MKQSQSQSRIRKENDVYVISVGQLCNNYCVMCYNPKYMRDDPTFDDLKQEIDELKDPQEIYISGGEATIRKDIFQILVYLRKKFPQSRLNLITNGRMFSYSEFTKKMKILSLNKVITELHGSNQELHDSITQVEGSFDQTYEGIQNMISNNINVELRIVINKMNHQDLPKLAEFINKINGLLNVTLFPINIIGDAYKYKERVAPRLSDIKVPLQQAIDILKKKNEVIILHTPYCVLDKGYYKFIHGVSTSENRLSFSKECDNCIKKDDCPRIWKTYLTNFGDNELKAIR